MQNLIKIRRRVRPLSVVLSIIALGVGSLGAASYLTGLDVQSIITGKIPQQVTVAQLQQGNLKPVLLIDVRSPEEYAEDRIGKSPLVSITDIEDGTGIEQVRSLVQKSTSPNQSKPTVIFYCTKGPRSMKAYKLLEGTGLNMAVLSGGITAWRKAIPAEQDIAVLSPITITSDKVQNLEIRSQKSEGKSSF